MATITVNSNAGSFNIANPDETDVVSYVEQTATTLAWETLNGNVITLTGSFTYAGAVPTGGSVTAIGFETNASGVDDIVIAYAAARAIVLELIAGNEQFLAAAFAEADLVTIDNLSTTDLYGDRETVAAGDILTAEDDVFEIDGNFSNIRADVQDVLGELIGGNDTITVDSSANAFVIGDAWSLIAGSVAQGGNDIIEDVSAPDDGTTRFYVGDFRNVYGLATGGDDVITGADIVVTGGSGYNELYGDTIEITGDLTGGDDTLTGGDERDQIYGDTAYLGAAGTLVAGGDVIAGNGGGDLLYGDASEADGTFTGGDDTISGGDGGDIIHGDYDAAISTQLAESGGDDTIDGGSGIDTIFGNGGADVLTGGQGDDTIDGGAGIDTLDYSPEQAAGGVFGLDVDLAADLGIDAFGDVDTLNDIENVTGTGLGDSMAGDGGGNTLDGGAGDDNLRGAGGDDVLRGASDNDSLTGGAGADELDGGDGSDTAFYTASTAAVQIDLAAGTGAGGAAAGDTFIGVENVVGSGHGDTLAGDSAGNNLSGGDGADILAGEGGADVLTGDGGSDNLSGGAGADTASYENSFAGVTIDLSIGSASGGYATGDTLSSIESLIGSLFADFLAGDTAANALSGGDGADVLDGRAGADAIDGGAGVDTLQFQSAVAGVALSLAAGGTGGDALGDSYASIEIVIATAFADALTGDAQDNTFLPFAGADALNGGDGIDTVSYEGSNGITVSLITGTGLWGDAQGDTYAAIENISGSSFFDEITGSSGANSLFGRDGDDDINGSNGDDQLFGGQGNDDLFGGAGADLLSGMGGTDTVNYSNSDAGVTVNMATGVNAGGHATGDTFDSIEIVTGSGFADTLTGGAGVETFNGGFGNDLMIGSAGGDRLNGNQDVDTADYSGSAAGINVNLSSGVGAGGDAAGDLLTNVENLIGSAFADTLTGSAGANLLSGGDGADEFNASSGDDQLLGEDGDDVMVGGAGADVFDGGEGTDWVYYSNADGPVTVNITLGTSSGSHAAGDSFLSIENLFGSFFDDTLAGSPGDNEINGFQGADTLSGASGVDVLLGGLGDDFLNGGPGDDVLSGYLGIDTFIYNLEDFGADTIIGFADGVDLIDLNAGLTFADFTETAAGPGTLLTLTADPANSIMVLGVAPGLIDASDFV